MSDYHLSLSIGHGLWTDLVSSALPLQVADGAFDLGKAVYRGVKQLQVRQKVSALLEDRSSNPKVKEAKNKISSIWQKNKGEVYKYLNEMLRVEGDWQVFLDREGTDFKYSTQKIGVDAHVKAVLHGKAFLLKDNVELPFHIEKRLGASCSLGDIRFDKGQSAVVGTVQYPMLDLGDHVVLQVLNEAIAKLLSKQVERFSSVPLVPKDQLEEAIAPAGGPLKLQLNIEDVRIEVNDNDLSLKVKFGFSQKQLTGA